MKKRHLILAVVSALGLLALAWAGGPAGTIIRLGPLQWSFASASVNPELEAAPRPGVPPVLGARTSSAAETPAS